MQCLCCYLLLYKSMSVVNVLKYYFLHGICFTRRFLLHKLFVSSMNWCFCCCTVPDSEGSCLKCLFFFIGANGNAFVHI